MPVTKQNVLRHELIGLDARVANSSDPQLVGVCGKIVDETRNTLVIEHDGRAKQVLKKVSIFRITLPSGEEVEVDGAKLVAPPEERVKKRR